MVFVLIVPSLAIGCEQVFGLTAMWAHPCQAHIPTLMEAAWKLMLLADESTNWPYAYAWMNDTLAHAPFSSEGHIGIMTEGLPSMNTYSCLDQLQVCRLLQCGGQVVCPEGLNGSLKALLFDFKELLLWNVANVDEPIQDLPLIDVGLIGMEPKVPPSTRVEDPLCLNLRGVLEQLQQASPATPLLSLAIHHFQDTTTISGPESSFPSQGNRKFSQICGNRARYLHPSGNSPTNFSPGNLTWQLSWLCPFY